MTLKFAPSLVFGGMPDPEALTLLHDMNERSELRIADENRCFHPKVYICRDKAKSVVWIGSANFTAGGFESNKELLLETSHAEHIESVNAGSKIYGPTVVHFN